MAVLGVLLMFYREYPIARRHQSVVVSTPRPAYVSWPKTAGIYFPAKHEPPAHDRIHDPLVESIRFALKSIAAEKVKACLTTLAVVIGSAAIVLVVAIGSVLSRTSLSDRRVGSNSRMPLDRGTSTVLVDELTPDDLSAVRELFQRCVPLPVPMTCRLTFARMVGSWRLVGVTTILRKSATPYHFRKIF
jgi:hypothetical protein